MHTNQSRSPAAVLARVYRFIDREAAIYFQRLISRAMRIDADSPASIGRRNLLISATLRPPGNVNGQEPFYVMMHVGECHVPGEFADTLLQSARGLPSERV